MEPVVLEIDDLLLRPWRPDDADAVWRAFQDPVLQRWTPSLQPPVPLESAAGYVGTTAPRALADGTGVLLGIFDAGSGELLGSTLLTDISADTSTAEIGYWSAPWARGRGVTERGSRALLRWGFDELGLDRVDWKADVGNHASRLVGLRLGVRMVGIVEGEGRAADGSRFDRWMGSLLPHDLTTAGFELDDRVRRRARVFGAAQPTLTGPDGVILRPPAERDLAGITATCQDPDTLRWTTVPDPYTEAAAAGFALWHAPSVWARGTAAVFVIAGADDAYTGTIDLRISPRDPAVTDVGYMIAPAARGRGQATAALATISRWALTCLGVERVEWEAHTDNPASRRVAEKAGFTIEGVLRCGIAHRGERRDCWMGSLLATDLPIEPESRASAQHGARVSP